MKYNHKDGISLRKLEFEDLDCLLDLKRESWWGTHNTLIINRDDQENWFRNIGKNELYLIAEKDSKAIGVAVYTCIDYISRKLSISGSIVKKYRVAEVVTPAFSAGLDFAFEILNMRRVEAEVLESNLASLKLELDHLGFTIEGRKRSAVYKSGVYYDSLILGLLRDEWEVQNRVVGYGGSCNLNFDHLIAKEAIVKTSSL
mgnify:CR=1 FL=1